MQIGDRVAAALAAVGIDERRVSAWLGKPCGCGERQERLNRLGRWAARVLAGKTDRAAEYLDEMVSEGEGER